MISFRQKSVNVSRVVLLEKLYANLKVHQQEYQEALAEYHVRLEADLRTALKKVKNVEDVEQLKKFRFSLPFPQNHISDFKEAIEMLELSVDDHINLDQESFRAFVKNEWPWSEDFTNTKLKYLVAGSSLSI